jgi:putative phosphonate metabolism protein
MRCAIYFVPPADDPLTRVAGQWLRRDPHSGAAIATAIAGLTDPDHALLTATPRRYGFHATLKAPFQLVERYDPDDLADAVGRFCRGLPPLTVPRLQPRLRDGTFALLPAEPTAELDALAASLVVEFDAFRAPPGEAELSRRISPDLTARQLSHLMSWGYPYIFDQFRFHMTLTGAVEPLERDHVEQVIDRHFREVLRLPLRIDQVAVAVEPAPHAPFVLHSLHRFHRAVTRRSA